MSHLPVPPSTHSSALCPRPLTQDRLPNTLFLLNTQCRCVSVSGERAGAAACTDAVVMPQFTRIFAVVALASVGFVAAEYSGSLVDDIPAAAQAYIKELTDAAKVNARSDSGHGMKPVERGTTGDCSVGAPKCCNQVINNSGEKKTLAGLLGLNDVIGNIGLNCANIPINAVGAAVSASNFCKSSPVVSVGLWWWGPLNRLLTLVCPAVLHQRDPERPRQPGMHFAPPQLSTRLARLPPHIMTRVHHERRPWTRRG